MANSDNGFLVAVGVKKKQVRQSLTCFFLIFMAGAIPLSAGRHPAPKAGNHKAIYSPNYLTLLTNPNRLAFRTIHIMHIMHQ